MIAIIDYGVGNLFSLKSSLGAIGEEAVVTRDESVLDRADHIILPGVGPSATRWRSCGTRGCSRRSSTRRPRANPSWASAWGCSCCLKSPLSTGSTPVWASFRGRCGTSAQ